MQKRKRHHSTTKHKGNKICKITNANWNSSTCAARWEELRYLLHLLAFLPVRSQILIRITIDVFPCDAAWKESFGRLYPTSAGFWSDIFTRYVHGNQQGHLGMWLPIVSLPPPCWVELLSRIKECCSSMDGNRNTVSIYAWQLKVHEMCFWAVSENWLIIRLIIASSIPLHWWKSTFT